MRNFICRLLHRDTRTELQQLTDGHIGINPFQLRCMSNSELARWQANHQNEPASVIIAEQEWLDRRLARQLRASFFVAIFGIAGTLAGIVLGWQLRSYSMDEHVIQYHGERSPKNQQQQEKPSTENEKPSAISAPTPVPQPRPNEDDTKTKKQ